MVDHVLGHFELPSVPQILRDPGRTEAVAGNPFVSEIKISGATKAKCDIKGLSMP